jgi:hypothetical protein
VCGIYTFHKKRSMPDHYGINVQCLADFDPQSIPLHRADGRTMSMLDPNPQPGWTGPHE